MKLVEDVFEAVYENLTNNGVEKIEVYIVRDNISMLHTLEKEGKEVSIRNIASKTK